MAAILGKKLGMTQVCGADGERVPVTAISLGPCVVVNKRTQERDKYSAIQLGFEDKKAERAQVHRRSINPPRASNARRHCDG